MRPIKIFAVALAISAAAMAQDAITQACVNYTKERNIAVSVFVLNPTGQIVHSHRMDG